ncbi:MAG: class I SAM-dependent methyltransferase [Imperialibacter sp.]|uniref:class I SAM-dependent methyltransferase n=1 Tax=Imperialibacter sp. TaxID=2038411 RepID=UPI0030D96C57|tara:strand:+ start:5085 stop:5984 length:900 start_codon:yes stop_codon:yes gene_type:complete
MAFHNSSYRKHAQKIPDKNKLGTWKENGTVDYWRHSRIYDNIQPLIRRHPRSKWVTIGDGRYGTDAHYLKTYGIDALATDISENTLKAALEDGYIDKYSVENAECLSFGDQAFDFVLCKEAYHHFPRPGIAMYEMLRIAKKGLILIEPNDNAIRNTKHRLISSMVNLWQALKNEFKLATGRHIYYEYGNYEPDGNYVYSISEREVEKIALGINLPAVAFKGMDDHYLEGVEYEKVADNGPLFKKVKNSISKAESLSKRGVKNYGLLIAIIFKVEIDTETKKALEAYGFRVDSLPRNPFV